MKYHLSIMIVVALLWLSGLIVLSDGNSARRTQRNQTSRVNAGVSSFSADRLDEVAMRSTV